MDKFLNRFFESQLEKWSLAKDNYQKLSLGITKQFVAFDLKGRVQYNPARAVSTLANLDK